MFTSFPYPGLRPFSEDETDIFFGREEQVDELLERLGRHRFVAVVGPSGCGKSSLVKAGLLDGLEVGFLAEAGAIWRRAVLRPGSHPLKRLAESLMQEKALGPERGDGAHAASFLHATLRRGPLGLVETLRETPLPERTNLLVLVDQFEEIFRYHRDGGRDEAAAFVALLLESAQRREERIYVVLTMRSDFLGDCALFSGLPEAMNESQYLTRRLAREQRRAAIVGPARVFGGEVSPELVNQLLNDMGPDPDQLPLMQHVMRRMWIRAVGGSTETLANREAAVPRVTVSHYEAVGGLANALSQHADEAFGELDSKQQRIAEVLFRCLCERGADQRDTRRPLPLEEVAEVAAVPPERVQRVVEAFRHPDRSFITPPAGEPLYPNTLLDISHESLIRQWKRLNTWVTEEAKSAETYRHLEQSALRWKTGEAGLWDALSVENALRWKQGENPNPIWASRYGSDFELAMEFLGASDRERRRRHEEKEDEQRRELEQLQELARSRRKTNYALVVIFAITVVLSSLIWRENRQQLKLIASEVLATQAVEVLSQDPQLSLLLAVEALKLSPDKPRVRTLLRILNEVHGPVVSREITALSASGKWLVAGKEDGSAHLWDTSGWSSTTIPTFEALMASTGSRGRRANEVAVPETRVVEGPKDPSALALSHDGQWLVIGTKAGSACLWKKNDEEFIALRGDDCPTTATPLSTKKADKRISFAKFSRNDRWLVTSDGSGRMELWDLSASPPRPVHVSGEDVSAADFSSDGSWFLTGSPKGMVRLYRLEAAPELEGSFIHDFSMKPVLAVAFTPDQDWAISGSSSGTVRLWDFRAVRERNSLTGSLLSPQDGGIVAAAVGESGRWLVTTSDKGPLRLWPLTRIRSKEDLLSASITLRGHKGAVRDVAFLANDNWLISRGDDGTIRVWDLASVERDVLSPVQGEEASITSLALTSDGRWKVTGHADGSVLLRDLENASKVPERLWQPSDVPIAAVKISLDDRWLAAVSTSRESKTSQFKLWDLKAGPAVLRDQDGVAAVDFGPESRLVTGDSDGTMRVWEVTEAGLREEMRFHWDRELNNVKMSHDGRLLLSAGTQPGAARLWYLDSRERASIDLALAPRPSRITAVAISPDSDWVAIALALGEREPPLEYSLYLWDLKSITADKARKVEPAKVLGGYAGELTALAMTTDDTLVAASGDGTVRVYELSSVRNGGEAKRVFPTDDGRIATVKISPDEKQFFTGGRQARARLWDLEDERLPIVVSDAEIGFVDGVFTPTGLVTASVSGPVRRSILDLEALKLEARRRVGRNLSQEEWEQFFPGESYRKTFSDLPAPEGAK